MQLARWRRDRSRRVHRCRLVSSRALAHHVLDQMVDVERFRVLRRLGRRLRRRAGHSGRVGRDVQVLVVARVAF